MYVVFSVPVGFEGHVKCKIFPNEGSKCRPVRCFCAAGWWTGLQNDVRWLKLYNRGLSDV
jgi:hypothetical protein